MDKQYASDPIKTYRDNFEELDFDNNFSAYQKDQNLNVLRSARQQYLTENNICEHGISCFCKTDARRQGLNYQKGKSVKVSGLKQITTPSAECNARFRTQRPSKSVSKDAYVQVTESDPEIYKYDNKNHPHEFQQKYRDTDEVDERYMYCPQPLEPCDMVPEQQYDHISTLVAPYEGQDEIYQYRNKTYSHFPNNGSKMVNKCYVPNQTSFHPAPYSNRFQYGNIQPVRQYICEPQRTDSYNTYDAFSNAPLNGRDWRKYRPVSSYTHSYDDEIPNTRRTIPYISKKVIDYDHRCACEKCVEPVDMNDRDWKKRPLVTYTRSFKDEIPNIGRTIPCSSNMVMYYDNRCASENCVDPVSRRNHFHGPRSFSELPVISHNPNRFSSSRYYTEYQESDSRYNTPHTEIISLHSPFYFGNFNLHTNRYCRPISEENMFRNNGKLRQTVREDSFRNVAHEFSDHSYKESTKHSTPNSNSYRDIENVISRNNTEDLYEETYKEPSSTQNESDRNNVNDDSLKYATEVSELDDQKMDITVSKNKGNQPLSRDTNRKILKVVFKNSLVQEKVFQNADKVLKELKKVLIEKGKWQGN